MRLRQAGHAWGGLLMCQLAWFSRKFRNERADMTLPSANTHTHPRARTRVLSRHPHKYQCACFCLYLFLSLVLTFFHSFFLSLSRYVVLCFCLFPQSIFRSFLISCAKLCFFIHFFLCFLLSFAICRSRSFCLSVIRS